MGLDYILSLNNSNYPVKNLAGYMGFEVTWTEPDQINLVHGNKLITMYLNKAFYTVNGVVAPYLEDRDIIMVPLEILADELGYQVFYDEEFNEVYIYNDHYLQ